MIDVDRITKNMETTKSYVEQLLSIVTATLADAYAQLRLLPDPLNSRLLFTVAKDEEQRDREYLKRRTRSEGLEFLTVALPELGDYFDHLVWGDVSLGTPKLGFKTKRGNAGQPLFLGPFFKYFSILKMVDYANGGQTKMTAGQAKLYATMRTLLLGLKKLEVAIPKPPEAGENG